MNRGLRPLAPPRARSPSRSARGPPTGGSRPGVGQLSFVGWVSFRLPLAKDLESRLAHRVQLTSDGFQPYHEAVRRAFGFEVDYAKLVKQYAADRAGEARYSPPVCVGCTKHALVGSPNPDLMSTSYAERLNLTIRTQTRRYTRLTNGWSRILSNHVYATALQFLAYNFIKKHATLKTTPAVAAGIASRPLTTLDIVEMIEAEETRRGGRITDYQPAKALASK